MAEVLWLMGNGGLLLHFALYLKVQRCRSMAQLP